MGKFKFTMRSTKSNKDGCYAIMLELSKNKRRSYISLRIWGDPKYWDQVQERFVIEKGLRSAESKKQNEDRKKSNDLLERYNQRAISVIEEFDSNRIDWTINQFKDAFIGRVSHGEFLPYLTNHVETLKSTGHTGNAKCYENLLAILNLFDTKLKERVFGEIDLRYVKKLDVFLQKRNVTGNTRKYYLKTLRSIINKAIQDKEASRSTYPFGEGGFEISALGEQTDKRYLPNEYLNKLKNDESKREVLNYARMLFLFSYYCYGMSFVDMARLNAKNIIRHDGGRYIVYKREKTKSQRNVKPIQVKVTKEIDMLIEKLRKYKSPISDYLLPIISINHSGEKLYEHIRNKSRRYNKFLKDLAAEFEFEFNLTSYVSRHTMAMQLQSNSIPREVISQVLGHADMSVTSVYLDSLDSSVIDAAGKVL